VDSGDPAGVAQAARQLAETLAATSTEDLMAARIAR
jgi:hypothetical protein